ncbi:unnamed protein product [Knipowitschia caucasica]
MASRSCLRCEGGRACRQGKRSTSGSGGNVRRGRATSDPAPSAAASHGTWATFHPDVFLCFLSASIHTVISIGLSPGSWGFSFTSQ